MNLVVVKTSIPFAHDESDTLAQLLVTHLNRCGHNAELVKLPYAGESVEAAVKSMIAAAMLRIRGVDRAIVHDFPSYYVRHEHRVAWLTGRQSPGENPTLHQAIANIDTRELGQMQRYAVSPEVQTRLKTASGLDSQLLVPPPPADERAWTDVVKVLTA
jgi:hypothetical protein